MGIGNKIITTLFFITITTNIFAMERSQPLAIPDKSSPEPYSFYIPTLADTYTSVTNSLDSLKNTVTNFASDYYAFRKLGWPPSDLIAQEELKKSKELYARVNNSIQTHSTHETLPSDYNAITRRNAVCQRVLLALDNYPDALNLALFCIQYHRPVMNDFDISRFLAFVTKEQEKSTKGMQEAYQELAKVMVLPNDNQLLNNFFKQNGSKPESEKNIELEKPKTLNNKKDTKK